MCLAEIGQEILKYYISNTETRLLGLATQDPVHLGNGVTGQVSLMASEMCA